MAHLGCLVSMISLLPFLVVIVPTLSQCVVDSALEERVEVISRDMDAHRASHSEASVISYLREGELSMVKEHRARVYSSVWVLPSLEVKFPRAPIEDVVETLKSALMLHHERGFSMQLSMLLEVHGFPHVARAMDQVAIWAEGRIREGEMRVSLLANETNALIIQLQETIPDLVAQLDACVAHYNSEKTRLISVLEAARLEQAEALRRVARTQIVIRSFNKPILQFLPMPPPVVLGEFLEPISNSLAEARDAEAIGIIFAAVRATLATFRYPMLSLGPMLQADFETASGAIIRPLVAKSLDAIAEMQATEVRISEYTAKQKTLRLKLNQSPL